MKQKKAIRTKDGFRVVHINRRRACRFACVECMGWAEGQVDKCDGKMLDGTTCALVDFKKMDGQQSAAKRTRAIRAFCMECMDSHGRDVAGCKAVYCPLYPYRNTNVDASTLFNENLDDDLILQMSKINQSQL